MSLWQYVHPLLQHCNVCQNARRMINYIAEVLCLFDVQSTTDFG